MVGPARWLLTPVTPVARVLAPAFSASPQETPRPSNNVDAGSTAELALMTQKLLAFGAAHQLDCAVDAAGNIRLRKPATPGYEKATKIVLQSHIDVVCSKSNDKASARPRHHHRRARA